MNATQRKFLVEKIQTKAKEKKRELENSRLKYPSASNYIFKSVMNDTLELQPPKVILDAIKAKAMRAVEGENWLSEERMGMNRERVIKLAIKSLLVLPEDYYLELQRVEKHNADIEAEIKQLTAQLDTIEVRIHLASDKTLQNLINDIDDMGDIRLVDSQLKLLGK